MDKVNIEELIADARAEEEVARSLKDDIRAELRNKTKEKEVVKITVDEYVSLCMKAADLQRLTYAIWKDLGLSYSGEKLTVSGENTLKAFEVLNPEVCEDVFESLQKTKEEEKTQEE